MALRSTEQLRAATAVVAATTTDALQAGIRTATISHVLACFPEFQRLTGVPLASGALSVFGFCGFLRKFCGILRMFVELCGFVSECYGIFAEFCGFLRIVCGILRTNTKGTRAKGHQCEAQKMNFHVAK